MATWFVKIQFRILDASLVNSQIWPENLKKSSPKKLLGSNKSISRKIFLTKFHFLQFEKWPKINFWTGKTTKNAISWKKNFLFIWFHKCFFAWTFLNFLALCVYPWINLETNIHFSYTKRHLVNNTFAHLWSSILLTSKFFYWKVDSMADIEFLLLVFAIVRRFYSLECKTTYIGKAQNNLSV